MSKEEMQDHQWLACLPEILDFDIYMDIYFVDIGDVEYAETEVSGELLQQAS